MTITIDNLVSLNPCDFKIMEDFMIIRIKNSNFVKIVLIENSLGFETLSDDFLSIKTPIKSITSIIF